MLHFIKQYLKHRTIKKYIKNIGPQLKQHYGMKNYYTENQVRAILDGNKFKGKYISYAYGLYLAPRKLDGILGEINESETSKSIREYLAVNYIGGIIDYSSRDIISNSGYCSNESATISSDNEGQGGDD